jgi:hypothetical protein
MSVQAKHAEIEWRRWADEETYYPLRDDTRAVQQHGRVRQYRARWAIEQDSVRKRLTDGEAAVGRAARWLYVKTLDPKQTNFEFVDSGGAQNACEARRLMHLFEKDRLANLEQVSSHIKGGKQCFHGICEGDSLAEIQRRCRMDRDHRGSIDLIKTVLRALELYTEFNEAEAERWNNRRRP